jgi:peptidoglycan/LPS O-acetylase OafA/YrhL
MLAYDGLRFVAASGIVFHHSNSFLYPAAARLAMKETTFGLALFVDLFFVISGYVIALVYGGKIKDPENYLSFLQKRIARLFPLHLVALAVFSTFYLLALKTGARIGSMPDLSSGCLAKTALMLHAIFPCAGASINPVSWSIGAEMVMYLIFPLLFGAACRARWAAWLGMILAVVATAVLSGTMSAHEWTQIYPPIRALPSFGFGVCLFLAMRDNVGPALNLHSTYYFVLGCLVLLMFLCMTNSAPASVVLASVYAVCILAAYIDRRPLQNSFTNFFAGMGRLTYAIYMIHLLLVTIIVNVIADRILGLSSLGILIAILVAYLLVVTLSVFSYSWIEVPLRRALSPQEP